MAALADETRALPGDISIPAITRKTTGSYDVVDGDRLRWRTPRVLELLQYWGEASIESDHEAIVSRRLDGV